MLFLNCMKEYPWIWELHRITNNSAGVPLDPAEWPNEWKGIEFKEYERYPRIPLPSPAERLEHTISDVFNNRKSELGRSDNFLSLDTLSTFLYWSAGVRKTPENVHNIYRFYPSAGARYPLEIYMITRGNNVLAEGVYHLNIKAHALEKLIFITETSDIFKLFLDSPFFESPFLFIITAVFQRSMLKYKERGYRFTLLEAGALLQNFYLIATALNLAPNAIGRAVDIELDNILELKEGEESVVALMTLGNKK